MVSSTKQLFLHKSYALINFNTLFRESFVQFVGVMIDKENKTEAATVKVNQSESLRQPQPLKIYFTLQSPCRSAA